LAVRIGEFKADGKAAGTVAPTNIRAAWLQCLQ
jgi:hypothetical protein